MDRGVVWTYLSLIKTAWIYISSGALRDVMKLRKGPVIAALYPVGFFDCPTGFCDFAKISGFHDGTWTARARGAFNRAGQGWDLAGFSVA